MTEGWRVATTKTVAVVSMDLSKAFDSIPLLLAKFKAYHLSERSIELLRSYLSGRIQHVKIILVTRFLTGNWLEGESPREVSWVTCFSTFTSMIYSTI